MPDHDHKGPDRRHHHDISEELIEQIAEKAAEKVIQSMYENLGRNIFKKAQWVLGALALAGAVWLAGGNFPSE